MKPTLGADVTSILAITSGALLSTGLTVGFLARQPDHPAMEIRVRAPIQDVRIQYLHHPVLDLNGTGKPIEVREGFQPLSMNVTDAVALSGRVRPGSHVDVLVTSDAARTGGERRARLVLQDVQVLANDRTLSSGPNGTMTAAVTLLLRPVDAETLAMAASKGSVHLVLREGSVRR
jgi:hypothetical protein